MNDDTISFDQVFSTLRKHFFLIVATTIIGGIVASLVTFFLITPQYSSSSQILVNRRGDAKTVQQYTADDDIKMISTYKDIITQNIILKDVRTQLADKVQYKGSTSDIQKAITISSEPDSQVFSVNVTSDNPYTASDIAKTTADVFAKKIGKIMNVNNASVISDAPVNKTPVSPKQGLNIVIGLVLGLLLGLGLAFIRELLDKTVKDDKFLADQGLASLGTVFTITESEKQKSAAILTEESFADGGAQ